MLAQHEAKAAYYFRQSWERFNGHLPEVVFATQTFTIAVGKADEHGIYF
jgi:hypothetical protein